MRGGAKRMGDLLILSFGAVLMLVGLSVLPNYLSDKLLDFVAGSFPKSLQRFVFRRVGDKNDKKQKSAESPKSPTASYDWREAIRRNAEKPN